LRGRMSRGISVLVLGFILMLRSRGGMKIIRCTLMLRRNFPSLYPRNSQSIRVGCRSLVTPWVPMVFLNLLRIGGHGALTLFLRNPGKYKSVSAFAPISNPMNCPWGEKVISHGETSLLTKGFLRLFWKE